MRCWWPGARRGQRADGKCRQVHIRVRKRKPGAAALPRADTREAAAHLVPALAGVRDPRGVQSLTASSQQAQRAREWCSGGSVPVTAAVPAHGGGPRSAVHSGCRCWDALPPEPCPAPSFFLLTQMWPRQAS